MSLQKDKAQPLAVLDLIEDKDSGFLLPHLNGVMLPGIQSVVVHCEPGIRRVDITLRLFRDGFRIVSTAGSDDASSR